MESTFSSCAYCWKEETPWDSLLRFKCDGCAKKVHYGCIKSPQPSVLLGDTFYNFKCQSCGEENKEEFHRMNMSWRQVVMLVLYNLHKTGQGRCGYFHWRAHICSFIDRHWLVLFGHHRKKTGLWLGTVAGTLSSGCPAFFESGVTAVEQGYWKLVTIAPPLPDFKVTTSKSQRKRPSPPTPIDVKLTGSGRTSRKAKANPLVAAIELKEKRATMTENRRKKRRVNDQNIASHEDTCKRTKSKSATQKTPHVPPTNTEASSNYSANEDVSQTEVRLDIKSNISSHASDGSSPLDSSFKSSGLNYKTVDSESEDSQSVELSAKPGKVTSGFENPFKSQLLDSGSESDLDIDIESMVMEPPSDINDMRPDSPDLNTLLDIEVSAPPVSGKSPVKMGSVQHSVHNFNEDDSEEEVGKSLQYGDGGTEEDFVKSDTSEDDDTDDDEEDDGEEVEEDEDDEDIQKASSQDENTDLQSEKELNIFKAKTRDSVSHKQKKKIGRPRKRRRDSDLPPPSPPQSLKRVSLFEEGELLMKLNAMVETQPLTTELAQLRRKLLCNQTNREFGLPVFDLDAKMEAVTKHQSLNQETEKSDLQLAQMFLPKVKSQASMFKETRDLDRFMMKDFGKKVESRHYSRFYQRLVGLEDNDFKPFVSPYTTRVLMPFIWRNFNMKQQPLKMRLLQEIKAYPHRNDATWKPEPVPPIDYCYVRPEHIPSVNALCREFFWPGIDMSECLQYPDFSCVVLYRKIVIGFAFMVPDRGYNEAYISFIFTHPEWRKVGIASFMLYHLIQTCMGKDVLLHVSASSPAMLLYQRFGFKAQELILNFYYKYFPLNNPDSNHAFLMRLSR